MSRVNTSLESRLERLIRPEIRGLSAYHVPDASGLVKLDAMENPYGLPEALLPQLAERLKTAAVNRYPDPQAQGIRDRLREMYQLPPDVDLLFGNGSDEIIQMLALLLGGPGRTLLSVEPAFVMYRMIALFTQTGYRGVDLQPDFSLDLPAVLEAIQACQPSLVFLAQPNNPTANLFPESALEAIVRVSPGLVVIDEAYTAFTDSDCLAWAERYDNVVVMRTFSKVGLAGLRFGMLFGPRRWIEEIDKVRMPYNINVLTQTAVELALDHFDLFERQCALIRDERAHLQQALQARQVGEVYPSEANFVLLRLRSEHSARGVHERMRQQGVLVKCLDGGHALLANCLRLTVGTPAENAALLQALDQALGEDLGGR